MEHPPEQLAPLVERRVQERSPVEVEEVEGEIRHRPARRAGEPPRELGRIRPAGVVDRHELAVEDRRSRVEPDRHPGQLRERRRHVAAVRVDDPDVARPGPLGRADERERAPPAPGRLEHVVRRIERLRQRARKHRPQAVRQVRQRLDVGLERQQELVAHRRPMVALDSTRPSPGLWSSSHPSRAGAAAPARPRRATIGGRSPVTTSSHRPARRSFRPEDLYRFRIATEPRLSPDGRRAAFTVQTVAPTKDGYRHAVWMADLDGDAPAHRLTLGAKHDRAARFSPDGRTLAFLSDRRHLVEEEPDAGDAKSREDGQQIHLLPLDGGEARRLTDLPRGVDGFEWSPDGRRLLVTSSSHGPNRAEDHRIRGKTAPPKPGEAPGVRLPLRRPARLPLQRPRLRLPRDRAALAGRRRDRRRRGS